MGITLAEHAVADKYLKFEDWRIGNMGFLLCRLVLSYSSVLLVLSVLLRLSALLSRFILLVLSSVLLNRSGLFRSGFHMLHRSSRSCIYILRTALVLLLLRIRNDLGNRHRFGICSTIRNRDGFIVFIAILRKTFVDAPGDIIHPAGIVEQSFFIGSSDETELYQTARHRGFSENQESCLMHALIRTVGTVAYLSLDIARQFYTSFHILTLYELEDDVALRRSRVETLIGLLIALLHRDNGVLSHSHIEIILGTVHTERISFKTAGYFTGWQRIGMYRDKQVGIGAVGDVGTLLQRNEDIRLTGIDDSHIRHIALNIFAKLQCH